MKLHLPSGLRAAILACFAAVSTVVAPPISATMAGGVVAVSFLCAAAPAMAEAVTWDANWNTPSAPSEIPDDNVLSDLPSGFTFLSKDGSTYTADGQTIVRLNGTAADATGVNIIGGAGMTTSDTSVSEGPITVNTWMKVTGGTYSTLVGGSYAQNYSGGDPASFTGDSHILLASESGLGTAPVVDYIIGGNYMDAQNAPFTGNSYISVVDGTVNGSIVGGGTSAHIRTAVFNGNSHVWVYTPLSGTAENRFELPGNFIIGGNAAINNYAPRLEQTGDSAVTIDLSSSTASTAMDKSIVGGAWLLGNTTSTHTGNTAVSITGTASGGSDIDFSQPIVAGSWFAGSGTASLSGNTSLSITGGSYAGALVGGAYMAADGASSYTMGNATITLNSGSVAGNIIGGSYVAAGSSAATQQTGDIALTVNGGTISGTIYGGSYSMRDNAESLANHGAVSISLAGGSITGNVYAGGGVAAGTQGGVKVASTQVEVSDSVVLGASGAGITISGGVENANAASGVAGDRTLVLSGSNYTNLDNATFHGFNIVNNASDVTLMLQEVGASFTKTGEGKLTINGGGSNLNPISSLTVEKGVLDTDTAWLTQSNNGLTAITIGAGASLMTDGLTLAQGATLALDVSGNPAGALIAEDGAGGLTLLGSKALNLELSQVESIAAGSSVTLLSWSNADAPLTLSNVTWLNKGTGLEAYSLGIVNKSLVLSRADSEELGGGTWDSTSDGKAVSFETPTAGNTTVTVSGDVTPQSVVVNNSGEEAYTFETDASGGSITGDASLTKNGTGGLVMNLENSYSGGTTINGGSVTAGVAGALGTGAVTLNEGGELITGQANAVAGNAVVFNGGELSYGADETRDLDTATISHEAGAIPQVAVGSGNNVSWTYDDAANLQSAIGEGLALSGGGTLKLEDTTGESVAINGPISLTEEGTTLEFGSVGTKQLGTAGAPVAVSLAEGTTLRVERPQADTPSTLNTALTGQGTLEIANTNAAADTTVQLVGNNAAFEGAVNLGTEGATPAAAATAPAVILDYSEGSPVGATLNLNGLAFATTQSNGSTTETAAAINVNADTTQFAQTAGLDNTFSGAVSGAADMSWTLDTTPVDGGQTNTLTGDLSGFEGTLEANGKAGSIARWVLGSGTPAVATFAVTPATVLAVNLGSTNEYNEFVFNYAEDVALSGVVSGSANLTQQGAGTLVLTGDNTSSGTLNIAEGSTVQLGAEGDAGQWGAAAGSELAGNGTLNLVNGTLNGPLTLAAGSLAVVNVEVAENGNVDLGGNSASLLTGDISVGEGGMLTGVAAGTIGGELNLALAEANIGNGAAAATAVVQFENGGTGSTLGSTSEAITLDLSNGNVVNLLREHRAAGTESFLTLTNGTLLTASDYSNVSFGPNMDILSDLGLRIARTEGGSLVLNGAVQGVYIAGEGEDPTAVTGYLPLSMYQAVAVMPGETLTLTLDGAPDAATEGAGALVNNLLGAEDSDFEVNNTNTAGEVAVVILNNSLQAIDPVPEGLPGDPKGANTTFGGDISESETGGDVEFVKTGAGILTVGGGIYAHQLTLQEGAVIFNDDIGSDLDILAMEGGDVQFNDGLNDVDSITDTDAGGRISLAPDATLSLAGSSTLEDTVISGVADNSNPGIDTVATTGAGTLEVTGDLTLAEDARLNGVALNIDGGTVTLDGTNAHRVMGLDGNGSINGTGTADTVGLTVSGTGGSFAGSLAGNGTLTVAAGAEQAFTPDFTGGAGWNLTNNGNMSMDFVKADGSNGSVALDALNLGADSVTGLKLNLASPTAGTLTLGSISAEPTATVSLSTPDTENIVRADATYTIGTVTGGQAAGVVSTLSTGEQGFTFMLLDRELSNLAVDEAGNLQLNLVTSRTNTLAPWASNPNSLAGAEMLWDAAFNGNTATGTDIRRVLETLNNTTNAAEADRILASVSGASVTVLSSAFASDVERQLRAIRNRTTMMSGKSCCTSGKGALTQAGPKYGVWVNGEGDHRKMKGSGYMPGYSLSSWGGTVGMDVSCSENLVGGLALTAMYGDLEARSAEHAEGDFDRYYITAFAKAKKDRWQHTLLGSVGRLDADLNRTVYFGDGSYSTHGSTKGWGYGLMYEIGYDLPVDENARFTLQPVANVTWRYVDVDGYSESGSDAGLRVDDQDYNVVTFGAGFRTKADVGTCWFNRKALFEGRALVKVDTGDRRADANVALLGGGGRWAEVRGEKLDAVGVELGAGLSIPLGQNYGSVFIDGTAELRNDYSNLNGTVGYRIEF